jgi:hypothetical protein
VPIIFCDCFLSMSHLVSPEVSVRWVCLLFESKRYREAIVHRGTNF